MRHPGFGMNDVWTDDLGSSLRQQRNRRRPNSKAVVSAVLPPVLGGITVLSLVLSEASLALAYVVGIADMLAGVCCVMLAASAWRLIRRPSSDQIGLVWAVAGAILSLGLIAVGLVTIALATALNNLTIPPF